MIVCYFIVNTLALVKRLCSHHSKRWCCPMAQNFVEIQSTSYKVLTQPMQLNAAEMKTEM